MESSTACLIQVMRRSIAVLGLSQNEVERRLGMSRGHLSRLFGGQIDLKFDHVVHIANVLGVEPEEFFRLAFASRQSEQERRFFSP
ncbi:MAG TPA: helix-turn-helix transcriptional regulator [Thermoanaerobaculia bacterium]|jgi:transcriptional regulator with XRE-family HTH domain|nr:helix-turn-helix transcriptional regulator [Thermoanaerobaculia bacterium]